MAWYIKHGLGGGFGGIKNVEWEHTTATSEKDAEDWAFEAACVDFEGYAGLHGVQSEGDIAEENPEYSEEDIWDAYKEERESWIDYAVKWFDKDPNEEV